MFMRSCDVPRFMVKFPFVRTWVIGCGPTYSSSYLFAFLSRTNTLSRTQYVCVLRIFIFKFFLSISFAYIFK